jgi:hypothetical protein
MSADRVEYLGHLVQQQGKTKGPGEVMLGGIVLLVYIDRKKLDWVSFFPIYPRLMAVSR